MSLSVIELERCERFINAYNVIDKLMRRELNTDEHESFTSLLRQFYNKGKLTSNQHSLLHDFASLRNAIVHQRTKKNSYMSVPIEDVVNSIETIGNLLLNPTKVIPKYQADVIKVNEGDSLSLVLSIIKSNDFSQFPVYSSLGQFIGVLTENGIARWLALHTIAKITMVEFEDHTVAEAVTVQENRMNFHFIDRNTTLLEAANKFMNSPELEAILITQNGKSSEHLLGIMTRFDIIKALNETLL
jgi:predicted transcriptional regulator